MATICPTITAYSEAEYKQQLDVITAFAKRIHIDLTDGKFTKESTIGHSRADWPKDIQADFHLMYKNPEPAVQELLARKPHLIVVHFEVGGNLRSLASACRNVGVKFGVALMPNTRAEPVTSHLSYLDHVLIFSGNLGYQGGSHADLNLLHKVSLLKQHNPKLEIGWDGGVNNQNASQIVFGGVDVLNVGGFIQNAADPEKAYHGLKRIADETGTT